MPMRSGTSPEAIAWAILGTIWSCVMYVRLIGRVGLAVFQAQASRSTICLLPPERSHACMTPGAVLWAQAAATSGADWAATPTGSTAAANRLKAIAAATKVAGRRVGVRGMRLPLPQQIDLTNRFEG